MDKTFDLEFEKDINIKFFPYVGDNYKKSIPRILVLGESHYFNVELKDNITELTKCNNNTETTRETVEEKYKPLTNTISMLTNLVINNDWAYNKLAFYNFFQKHIGYGSSDKSLIDNSLIEQSQKAFFSVIEIIKPELVIAWGIGDLYEKWMPHEEYEIINEDNTLYRYKKYMETYIWHIHHPSAPKFNLCDTTSSFFNVCNKLKYHFPIIKE